MLRPKEYLLDLAPYQLADTAAANHAETVQLAQNESYLSASVHALAAARSACQSGSLYPPADARRLREAIGKLHRLDPDRIVCGRGAMELISLLAAVYLAPGNSVVTSEFGYMYFKTAAKLNGAKVLIASEPHKNVDIDNMAGVVGNETRIVFIANPGNPTGSFLAKQELTKLVSRLPESTLLVIDEAYAEYVEPSHYQPCFDLTEHSNTVVLRTFSKIYGLAGMRIGWGYFPRHIAQVMHTVLQPNAVTGPSQAAAAAAIEDQAHIETVRRQTCSIRNHFVESLLKLGFNPLPSHGNFVLVQLGSKTIAAVVDQHLRTNGIIVRPMSDYGLADCLRITIGNEGQMQKVIDELKKVNIPR